MSWARRAFRVLLFTVTLAAVGCHGREPASPVAPTSEVPLGAEPVLSEEGP